jgi:hypothetical protein
MKKIIKYFSNVDYDDHIQLVYEEYKYDILEVVF